MVVLVTVTVSLVVAVVNSKVSTPTPRSIVLPVMTEPGPVPDITMLSEPLPALIELFNTLPVNSMVSAPVPPKTESPEATLSTTSLAPKRLTTSAPIPPLIVVDTALTDEDSRFSVSLPAALISK